MPQKPRVTVRPDPVVDDGPVPIDNIRVGYRAEIPGETVDKHAIAHCLSQG